MDDVFDINKPFLIDSESIFNDVCLELFWWQAKNIPVYKNEYTYHR